MPPRATSRYPAGRSGGRRDTGDADQGDVPGRRRPAGRRLPLRDGRRVGGASRIPGEVLRSLPPEAVESFAGVGYFFDLAKLSRGEHVLDLGGGSGTDAFFAALQVGSEGSVTGIDMTPQQLAKAERLRSRDGFANARFIEGPHRQGAAGGRRVRRRRHLERRDQPLPGQSTRVQGSGASPPARWAAGARRHRQREAPRRAHPREDGPVGCLYRRSDPGARLLRRDRSGGPVGGRKARAARTVFI